MMGDHSEVRHCPGSGAERITQDGLKEQWMFYVLTTGACGCILLVHTMNK